MADGLPVDGRQCPPIAWHILEIIVNGMMVVEVSTRWVAYGKVSRADLHRNGRADNSFLLVAEIPHDTAEHH